MSLSNNTDLINPAKFFFEWVGSKGCLKYFDKSRGEKGEQVLVPLPFSFRVLDRLATIKGYSDEDKSGFWANEVRDIKKELFTVRTKKGIAGSGYYAELPVVLKKYPGWKYSQSVYIAVESKKGDMFIANIQMDGASIGPWIDLCKGKNIYKFQITIADKEAKRKGTNDFFIPIFKTASVTEESTSKAIALDKELQEYLSAYFSRGVKTEVTPDEVITDRQREDIKNFTDKDPGEPIDTFYEENQHVPSAADDDLPF